MAATVRQTNKTTGITYVYESVSYWDKAKQQSRARRVCIGKVDPETGNVIPTRKTKPKAFIPDTSTKPDRCRPLRRLDFSAEPRICLTRLVRIWELQPILSIAFQNSIDRFCPLPITLFWKTTIR